MLTLSEVMDQYSHIRLADKSDNDAILNFYKDIHMQTGAEALSFDRGDNFFEFYERKGNHYWSFVFLNDDKSICGVGTIIRQVRRVAGEYRPVAYFCDLRVAQDGGRRAKVQWRKCFKDILDLLPKLPEDQRCDMNYTAILSDNERAIESLTRNGRGYNYRHIHNYHVYSVVVPPLFNPARGHVEEISFDSFKAFYKNESQHLELMEELYDDEANSYYGFFDGKELVASFMTTQKSSGRLYKLYNMQSPKKILTRIVEMTGKPKVVNGILKTLEIQYLTFKSKMSHDAKKESILGMIKFLKENKILKEYHICNFYTGQDQFDFSFLIDGIVIENAGHMFEIHGDETGAMWPTNEFRFEGSVL